MLYPDDAEQRRERLVRSQRQEEQLVVSEKNKGNISWRIAREIDVVVFHKSGITSLVDCKFSDNDEFWIESGDIIKGLDLVKWLINHGISARFRVDMHFPRTRKPNNRRYIDIGEEFRGWSMRCWHAEKRILTKPVRRGKEI